MDINKEHNREKTIAVDGLHAKKKPTSNSLSDQIEFFFV